MRKFKLINADGQTFDLMRKDAFLHAPDGLGFEMNQEFAKVGNAYLLLETDAAQKAPNGEMVFNGYTEYFEFTNFISKLPLKLCYKPLNEWFYLDCSIASFNKSEIDKTSKKLICAIDFVALSKWYIPRIAARTSAVISNSKKYPYKYNYTYSESINGIINIVNNGSDESPCIINIFGNIVNPTWSLVKNNKIISSGALSATIDTGNKLIINSKDNELEIGEYTRENVFVRNRYQDTDLEKENFILIPNGQSTMLISGSTSSEIEAYIEVIEVYETI